jgi:hypothetical protein
MRRRAANAAPRGVSAPQLTMLIKSIKCSLLKRQPIVDVNFQISSGCSHR